MDPPSQPFYSSLSRWVIGRAKVDRHVESFAEVLENLCGELRAWVAAQRQGYPECYQQFEESLGHILRGFVG